MAGRSLKSGQASKKRKDKKLKGKKSIRDLKPPTTPVPVTVLSGFLGAGKSTLLKHILESDQHGKRIACIVNDMGAINIDANNIKQIHDEVIDLANGCICCTLRTNLIEELVKLSSTRDYDYIIIESSGISEPAQVAEIFDPDLIHHVETFIETPESTKLDAELLQCLELLKKNGGLEKWVRLDTCVTVVDSFTIYSDFNTDKMMSDRREDAKDEDRTVVELLIDQLEFANVILVNKIDMVDDITRKNVKTLIKKLNHKAKILECEHGKIDVNEIIDTKLFDLKNARESRAWMEDIWEMTIAEINGRVTVAPKPETEEYNVRNFIYSRYRPFHPTRLWHLIRDKFICNLEDASEDMDLGIQIEHEDDDMEDVGSGDNSAAVSRTGTSSGQNSTPATSPGTDQEDKKFVEDEEDNRRKKEPLVTPTNEEILETKAASAVFARLFRSKGQIFLASRPQYTGSWSQAGPMLDIGGAHEWSCILHKDKTDWDLHDELQAYTYHEIKKGGEWGDRSQQIVFIGEALDIAGIEEAFDECLLTKAEMKDWERVMRDTSIKDDDKYIELEKLFPDDLPDWAIEFGDDEWEDELDEVD